MAVLDGCESAFKTPVPEERTCPQCGREIEVFTVKGRVVERCGLRMRLCNPGGRAGFSDDPEKRTVTTCRNSAQQRKNNAARSLCITLSAFSGYPFYFQFPLPSSPCTFAVRPDTTSSSPA